MMFTDIIGYTALMSKDEQKALALLQKNRDLQKSLAKKHNGEFLKEMGDGTLLCFQSALDAVRCAMEIQESVKDDPGLNLRIGIHLGDIVFRECDVFGDGVNVASRIERLAEAGGICVSEQIYLLLKNQPDIHAEFIGEKALKNVDDRIKVYRMKIEGEKSSPFEWSIQKEMDSREKSIVVLPFDDMSPNKDNEYFSDGLTEEIMTDLSRLKKLRVISRTSAMMLKQTQKPIRTIGQELDVQYVLEGSVRKAGQDLRITAQLINARNDNHIWAEKYKGTLDDVFDIQEKVSRSIVNEIELQLTPDEEVRIGERGIENIQAYEYYLRARREIYKLTREGLDNALQYLKKGMDIVGENVLLYASMGLVYYQYWNYGVWPDIVNIRKAEECAYQVFEMEPDSKHGHFLMGLLQIFINPPQALKHFKQVLCEDPYHPETLLWLSMYLVFQGKQTHAGIYIERLTKVDPLNPIVRILPGNLHFHCGRLEPALEIIKRVIDADPDHFVAQFHYARALAYADRLDEAFAIIGHLVKKNTGDMRTQLFQLYQFAFKGKKSEVLKSVNQEFLAWAQRDWMVCLWLTEIFALINEHEMALDWLSQAVNLGAINYPFLNAYNPFLKNIRKEVRFKKLMETIKPKWENFEL